MWGRWAEVLRSLEVSSSEEPGEIGRAINLRPPTFEEGREPQQ